VGSSLDALLHGIVIIAAELTNSQSAAILLFSQDQAGLPLVAASNSENELFNHPDVCENLLAGMAFSSDQPILLESSKGASLYSPDNAALSGLKVQTMLAVPLQYKGQRIGIMNVENKIGGETFENDDAEVLRMLAVSAAYLIENARANETLNKHNQHLESHLGIQNQEINQLKQAMETLQEQERKNRDLSDELADILSQINSQTLAMQTLLINGQSGAAGANLERITQLLQEAQASIGHTIFGTPSVRRPQSPLVTSLEEYIAEYSAGTGIQARLSLPDNNFLPAFAPLVENNILHIIHEALTNTRKHAQAHITEVIFSLDENNMQVIITDDGIGFDLRAEHARHAAGQAHPGLSKMYDRAEIIGGRLEVRSAPGRGTKIILFIPASLEDISSSFENTSKNIQDLRILLVDDSAIFVEGLSSLLTTRGLTVAGVARDGLEAQEKARQLHPDIIVMDVVMPNCNGLQATRAIHSEFPEIKILMLTSSEKDEHLYESIKNGASGFLLKGMDANEFCTQLANLARGETLISAEMAARLITEFSPSEHSVTSNRFADKELSDHQWKILDLVAGGMTYKEVGATLHLSEKTIKYHMAQILDRLHLKNRAQAIAFARRFVHEPGEPV
jgi:two-component system NarL family response regulator